MSPNRAATSRPESAIETSSEIHPHHSTSQQPSPELKPLSNDRRKSDDLENDECDADDDEPFVGRAQYLTTNLILITNYNGDTQTVVDNHFSRALGTGPRFNEENNDKGKFH
jgi:hypothetical protein